MDEVVVLNGTEEEMKKQRETMEERRRAAKMAKVADWTMSTCHMVPKS